eukprot:COSAG01_NODE_1182_length_11347_cov_7.504356_14_plen_225_part_01
MSSREPKSHRSTWGGKRGKDTCHTTRLLEQHCEDSNCLPAVFAVMMHVLINTTITLAHGTKHTRCVSACIRPVETQKCHAATSGESTNTLPKPGAPEKQLEASHEQLEGTPLPSEVKAVPIDSTLLPAHGITGSVTPYPGRCFASSSSTSRDQLPSATDMSFGNGSGNELMMTHGIQYNSSRAVSESDVPMSCVSACIRPVETQKCHAATSGESTNTLPKPGAPE